MLDLFCGRFGWSKAFAERGWECVGVDLVAPPEIPDGCTFIQRDILTMTADDLKGFYFICASPPCEQFSVHGMPHFHPNPKYPDLGLKLFNHTREICEASGVPYVMENVRTAQKFVGDAVHHCGPFYLWGNSVPAILPQGIKKGLYIGSGAQMRSMTREQVRASRKAARIAAGQWSSSHSKERQDQTAAFSTIPPELSNSVADYAERILDKTEVACG
jgi:hypothetical protein